MLYNGNVWEEMCVDDEIECELSMEWKGTRLFDKQSKTKYTHENTHAHTNNIFSENNNKQKKKQQVIYLKYICQSRT